MARVARTIGHFVDIGAGVAQACRGRGAGYRHFLAWVARAWRGHVERACPVTPGVTCRGL
eukprot:gene14069-biopygen3569